MPILFPRKGCIACYLPRHGHLGEALLACMPCYAQIRPAGIYALCLYLFAYAAFRSCHYDAGGDGLIMRVKRAFHNEKKSPWCFKIPSITPYLSPLERHSISLIFCFNSSNLASVKANMKSPCFSFIISLIISSAFPMAAAFALFILCFS